MEVPIENGRPDVEEDLHLSNEEEEGDDPHPEESDYDDDSSENHDFHSYHTLHLLNNNQSDKPSKNESVSQHEKTEGQKSRNCRATILNWLHTSTTPKTLNYRN